VVEGETLRAPTWAYDPASGEWRSDLAEIPTFREHLAAVPVDGGLIAIGGRGTQSVDAVERYDPAADTWTALAPLPAARGGLAAAVLDGRVHVVGGEGIDPVKIFRDHEVLDLATGTWALAPPMERGRHGLGAGVIDGRLYAVGGGPSPDLSTSDRVDVFDP
jgi:non-specific serine/threonine protein kinase